MQAKVYHHYYILSKQWKMKENEHSISSLFTPQLVRAPGKAWRTVRMDRYNTRVHDIVLLVLRVRCGVATDALLYIACPYTVSFKGML